MLLSKREEQVITISQETFRKIEPKVEVKQEQIQEESKTDNKTDNVPEPKPVK